MELENSLPFSQQLLYPMQSQFRPGDALAPLSLKKNV
jgi:hypothetical protein